MRTTIRRTRLGEMLRDLRRQTQSGIRGHLHAGRSAGQRDVGDELDRSDSDTQGDLALALLQMEMETLARIDHALARLDEGSYGRCLDCDQEISEPRLRALPFAIRCRACEVEREQVGARAPSYLARPGGLFTNWVGF